MGLSLTQRAEAAERSCAAQEFSIISEAALAVFGWQDERYKRVLRLLEAGASLDAAMTLVPEGFLWVGGYSPTNKAGMAVCPDGESDGCSATAATPALALCAAVLRALAAQAPEVAS